MVSFVGLVQSRRGCSCIVYQASQQPPFVPNLLTQHIGILHIDAVCLQASLESSHFTDILFTFQVTLVLVATILDVCAPSNVLVD